MTRYGTRGKPKAGFPPVPQRLGISPTARDSHIPTAPAAAGKVQNQKQVSHFPTGRFLCSLAASKARHWAKSETLTRASLHKSIDTAVASSINISDPQSFQRYYYAQADPINLNDPSGLDVHNIPETLGSTPTCLGSEFITKVSDDLNGYLNSDAGTMALQVYFEWRGLGSAVDTQVWEDLAIVIRNRWQFSAQQKQAFGISKWFRQEVYQLAGTQWNKPRTPAARQSFWDPSGYLKASYYQTVVGILNSSPDSSQCRGFISALVVSNQVYYDQITYDLGGALFYYSSGGSVPQGPTLFGIPMRNLSLVNSIEAFTGYTRATWFFYSYDPSVSTTPGTGYPRSPSHPGPDPR